MPNTQNLGTLQTNIASFDLTTLSSQGQTEAYALLQNLLKVIVGDVMQNASDPSSIFTALTNIQTNDHTPPTQVNADKVTP